MKLRDTFTVYRKELCEALRDRRTLISMFLVPAVIMPAIFFLFGTATYQLMKSTRTQPPVVAVLGGEDSPAVRAQLEAAEGLVVVSAPHDWRERIADKQLRAVVEIPPRFEASLAGHASAQVKIYHYEGEFKSGFAAGELRRFFTELRERTLAERLTARSLPADFARPFEIRSENVAPPEKVGGAAFGGFIPYVLILLSFTGVIYPAIDLMAGEKERGTMETLLCSPAARLDLVLGKFLLVLTISLTTVLCSLVSMAVSLVAGGLMMVGSGRFTTELAGSAAGGAAALPSLDPLGLVGVVVLVVPLAVLFAAVALTLSLFARTQKEAQTYLGPLVAVVLLPAVAGVLPGVELNSTFALVPVLNVTLACKELVSGVWLWPQLALIFGSTCVYAAASLAWCVRMFSRESVLFRS
ncbi:ABC transporter permease [Rariglobus hedericola]|uniref:ABC transporter permease n=1 Tax=Rariglobus hedericola TaxID=2597822 RepID=A0A556QGE7_9BACT|nr:ABC transporter permease [Rariglobus hedericola]TSJ75713.1 ABC transporter permease [Rariglobus hedericola]